LIHWINRSSGSLFDALRVKIRDAAPAPGQDPRCCAGPSRQWRGVSRRSLVKNKAVYVALAITCEGDKEVLGLWIEQTEGAKFCPRA
jgi:hypothetical protein